MSRSEPTRVLLGVTGGIAAYKSAELVRRLREGGAEVQVVMTEGARHFVTPLTFQALSGRPVRTDLWDEAGEAAMGHIELARWADRILVAPATADFIARLAHGFADDLLTTLCLATDVPLSVAPAMNRLMWANAATQANVELLRSRGIAILGPGEGEQACGETGPGRMLEPATLADAVLGANLDGAPVVPPVATGTVAGTGLLAGRKVPTAPTRLTDASMLGRTARGGVSSVILALTVRVSMFSSGYTYSTRPGTRWPGSDGKLISAAVPTVTHADCASGTSAITHRLPSSVMVMATISRVTIEPCSTAISVTTPDTGAV
jgi:hypothetical protein